jgi:hypothetical protein
MNQAGQPVLAGKGLMGIATSAGRGPGGRGLGPGVTRGGKSWMRRIKYVKLNIVIVLLQKHGSNLKSPRRKIRKDTIHGISKFSLTFEM